MHTPRHYARVPPFCTISETVLFSCNLPGYYYSAHMEIVSIWNVKGGVGKTTSAVNLAAALGARNKRVLIIDNDPQANASKYLGVNTDKMDDALTITDVYRVEGRTALRECIVEEVCAGVDLVPSNLYLGRTADALQGVPGGIFTLSNAMAEGRLNDTYDFVFVDCPPSTGQLVTNALLATNTVILPIEPAPMASNGLAQCFSELPQMTSPRMNPDIAIGGVLYCRVNPHTVVGREVMGSWQHILGPLLFETRIPAATKVMESSGSGRPLRDYDAGGPAYRAYEFLADEFLAKQRIPFKSLNIAVQ